jgi:hypothetical protein
MIRDDLVCNLFCFVLFHETVSALHMTFLLLLSITPTARVRKMNSNSDADVAEYLPGFLNEQTDRIIAGHNASVLLGDLTIEEEIALVQRRRAARGTAAFRLPTGAFVCNLHRVEVCGECNDDYRSVNEDNDCPVGKQEVSALWSECVVCSFFRNSIAL